MVSCIFQLASSLAILLLILECQASFMGFPRNLIVEDLSKLQVDHNGRLLDNWILYQDTPECKNAFMIAWEREEPNFRKIGACSANITETFFGSVTPVCSAVSLMKGMMLDLLSKALPHNLLSIADADPDLQQERIRKWIQEHQEAEIGWTSHVKSELTIYWINPNNGEKTNSGKLEFGEKHTVWLSTRLGHEFEIIDDSTNTIMGKYPVEHDSFFVVGTLSSRSYERDVTEEVRRTFVQEWARSRNVKRTFTELGFTLGKLPPDLWGSMSAYYYNNRNNKVREEWDSKGIFVNWWETDVFMIGMPWNLKRYWQARLMTLVEAWSGVELELTDIYGMRRYEEGARLLSHVDREQTHAASLIINVAQGGVREPWAVEIYDFADRLHEITMEEGDVVYYESARCLHGRMKPLQGQFYVNLFAHYRPKGDPAWFTKENPADGVPHLLDIGDCKVNDNAVNCTNSNGKVPFLSPTLEKLNGPHDLLKYWKETAPGYKVNEPDL